MVDLIDTSLDKLSNFTENNLCNKVLSLYEIYCMGLDVRKHRALDQISPDHLYRFMEDAGSRTSSQRLLHRLNQISFILGRQTLAVAVARKLNDADFLSVSQRFVGAR